MNTTDTHPRRWLVTACAVLATGCPDTTHSPSRGVLSAALLALDQRAAASLSLDLPPAADTRHRLATITARLRRALAGVPAGESTVTRLNRLLFEDLGFEREINDRSPEAMLLSRVLASRRGSCVGLGMVYLTLGEQLDLPLSGVLVPGHFFVRYDDGGQGRDIELLRRGERMPHSWYGRKYGSVAGNPLYLQRGLSTRQSLAVYRFKLANEHRLRGRYREALAEYRRVLVQLPRFAEARANLGLTHQLLGQRLAAVRAYRRALRDNPQLAGIEKNLRSLAPTAR